MASGTERRVRAVALLVAASAALCACGLVLGIDDIPPVNVVPDAGKHHADGGHDAGHDAGVDTGIDVGVDTGHDAGVDRGVTDASDASDVGRLVQPSGMQTTSDADMNFAIHRLWLGDTDKTDAFVPASGAWATFGYNIDGKVTTSTSTDVCTLQPGVPTIEQVDGNEGADDSFGANLVGDLSIAFQGISYDLTSRIEDGFFDILIDTTGLSTSPTQTNVGLTTGFYGGARFPGTPTFTLADNWPVDPNTLADGVTLANGARIQLSDSYVVGGTWVSGQPTDLIFTVELSGVPLELAMHQAVATFQHDIDDAGANHALNGMVAGVFNPNELIASLKTAAGSISNGMYCDLVTQFSVTIVAAQDIMLDGTNVMGESCNGISVALAFTADQIQTPSVVAPATARDGSAPKCRSDAGDAAPD